MPDGGGATLLEDLPEEIIDNILIRLPSRDVGRCRAVSASWRTATSTPEFMLRHHHRQPSLPIIRDRGMLVAFRAGASSQEKLWPFLPGAKYRYSIDLRGACDGLIAVSWRSRFYVCNPVIRKHALLPQPQLLHDHGQDVENKIIGFYRHHPTGEHRVLWVSQHSYECSLHILTVGCDTPRLPTRSSPSYMEHMILAMLFCSDYFPVVDHGNLHWHPNCAKHATGVDGQITVFDTGAESFRWMHHPAQLTYNLKLFSMKGRLAFSGSSRCTYTAVDVWVMQDYEAETWAFRYRIDLSVVEASRQLHLTSFEKEKEKQTLFGSSAKWIYDMVALDERELLIMSNTRGVLRCDVDGMFLGMVNTEESPSLCGMQLTQFRLQESMIPVPYHEMQEEDEEDPFSIEQHV